jgi:hypothetical protein
VRPDWQTIEKIKEFTQGAGVIWIIALICMGTGCMLNARRCNRTHCRYTGLYSPAMTVPVMALGGAGSSPSAYLDGFVWA